MLWNGTKLLCTGEQGRQTGMHACSLYMEDMHKHTAQSSGTMLKFMMQAMPEERIHVKNNVF